VTDKVRKRLPVRLTLAPGKRGTLGLLQEYGDRLVCVRYRYDAVTGRRYKTVELIVSERERKGGGGTPPGDRLVKLRVLYQEWELREVIKRAGGYWDRKDRVWFLRYSEVEKLGLEGRVTE
jgi:hypothetical protein